MKPRRLPPFARGSLLPDHPLAPATLCRTCRRPLDSIEFFDDDDRPIGFRYLHTALDVDRGNADHEPDPILRDETIGSAVTVCDFCSAPGPRWTYGCEPFRYQGLDAGSADDWAACDRCHELIAGCHWRRLADRSMDSMAFRAPYPPSAPQRAAMRRHVMDMHQQFAQHRTGPPTSR